MKKIFLLVVTIHCLCSGTDLQAQKLTGFYAICDSDGIEAIDPHNGNAFFYNERPIFNIVDIVAIEAYKFEQETSWSIIIDLNDPGSNRLRLYTTANQKIALIVDNKVHRVITVTEPITTGSLDLSSFKSKSAAVAIMDAFKNVSK